MMGTDRHTRPPVARTHSDRTKRLLDLAVALPSLIVLSPVLALTAVAIRRSMGPPVLFRQDRSGQGGRPFQLVKFRTMRPPAVGEEGPESDGDRLTALGRFLRTTSADELPSLWNVVKGDISLVGPRPLPVRYLPRYDARQIRRLEVKPGLTGWAQVNGRNSLSWGARFDLDLWYVENRTLLLDLRILMLTVSRVVRREGISQEAHATMSEFTGHGDAGHDL